jgi:hypothetical protein
MGPGDNQERFDLISPMATLIQSTRPVFRWLKVAGATNYSIAVLDLNLNVIEKSETGSKTSWTPARPLKRNVIYTWQVTAQKDGREIVAPAAPAHEARFKIISSEAAAAVARAAKEIGSSHLKLGIIYAQSGLLDEAEAEFRLAIAANDDSTLARQFLESSKRMRR